MEYPTYKAVEVKSIPFGIRITLNRLKEQNSINLLLIQELGQVLDSVEQDTDCRVIILSGQQGVFCTGMDFKESNHQFSSGADYMKLLRRFSLMQKVIIAEVDGIVMAGGIGLMAACDLVVATPRSQFSLPEALWGLLPANVLPYLIRRIGYQKAYQLTLTTQTITAAEALECHLIDELTETLDDSIRRYLIRVVRLDGETIQNMKAYFRRLWIITESMEEMAVAELGKLISSTKVQENIRNFVEHQKFPWEKTEKIN